MTNPNSAAANGSNEIPLTLADLGWSAHFESQIEPKEIEQAHIGRVTAVHRNGLDVIGPGFDGRVPPVGDVTAGDWLLADKLTLRVRRVLQRRSLFKRRAAGSDAKLQLIAANVDTLFIVSSCNLDFNQARIERYLALARDAEVTPVIILTKSDLAEDTPDFVARAAQVSRGLFVEAVDARAPEAAERLAPWLGRGQTIALMGSSGVGKSTLLNTLSGTPVQTIGEIRHGDDKGKHTTTGRSLHRLGCGAWLIDTPGMRELQLTDVQAGIRSVFGDVVGLASECRFTDCRHDNEPGCAVRAAINDGRLDEERLKRYRKLEREDERNAQTLAEAHAKARAFGRLARRSMRAKRDRTEF